MVKENAFLTGKIGKTLIWFALPFLAANLLQSLYGAVDLFVVGQFTSTSAVSSVATGSQIMQTITFLMLGLCTGGVVLLGKGIGENDFLKAKKAIGNLILLCIVCTFILTSLMLIGTNAFVAIMQTPKEAIQEAREYVFICSLGLPAIIGYNAVSSIIRGTGDSKTPLLFVGIACICNIAFDFILVAFFHMGAKGAAIATVVSQLISFLVSFIYLRCHDSVLKLSKEDLKWDKAVMGSILKVGIPLALQDTLVNLSFLLITAIMNSLGLIASSAVGVSEKILGFAFIVPSAFAQSLAIMASQNIGAKQEDRAKKALWFSILCSFIIGLMMTTYCELFPESLASIFEQNPEVIQSAASYLRSYSIDCVIVAFIFNFNSYFSSYNKAHIAFIHSMIATFAIRIPVSYFVSKQTSSMFLIGLASPLASLFSAIFCFIIYYFSFVRYKKRINSI